MVLATLTSCCTPLTLYANSSQCHLQPNKYKYKTLQKALKSSKAQQPTNQNLLVQRQELGTVRMWKQRFYMQTSIETQGWAEKALVAITGTSPCGGLRLGSTPWPAVASHLVQASASLQGHRGQPLHWDGSAWGVEMRQINTHDEWNHNDTQKMTALQQPCSFTRLRSAHKVLRGH